MRGWTIVGAIVAFQVVAGLVLRLFFYESFVIPAASMAPNLNVGDKFFVDKRDKLPHRGDVIVFKYPQDPAKDYVKRVVAVGGDTIELDGRTPIINGERLKHEPLDRPCTTDEGEPCLAVRETNGTATYEVIFQREPRGAARFVVPAGQVYVLGDNRDNSSDSRVWGTVPLDFIKGRATKIWWSKNVGTRWANVP